MRTRKVLFIVTLFLLIISFLISISCTEEEATEKSVSSDFNTYSGYGFSFEYPRGFSISEMGILMSQANDASGLVQAMRGEEKFLQVVWLGMIEDTWEFSGGLSQSLEDSFWGMTADGTITSVERDEIIETTKGNHQVIYQDFIGTIQEGDTFGGVIGCFYCDKSEKLYQLMAINMVSDSKQDRLALFNQLFYSLLCH